MSEPICGYIEYEEHVFVTCSRYEDIRLVHNIYVENFYSLLHLVTFDLNCYIRDIISYYAGALGTN